MMGKTPKRNPLSCRVDDAVRARIEQAAVASGLSMAQEIERRLLASFDYADAADYLRQYLIVRGE